MEEIKLSVEKRASKGTKKELSTLRSKFRIPAIIYGDGKPEIGVAVSEKELLAARKKGGVNAILHLDLDGTTETVILKELQRHPVSERPIHADFQRISLSRKITAKVPLEIVGEAPGVKSSGGILQHELRVLSIRALPTHIPQHISVDVSKLELNQHILVKDLAVGTDVEILDSPEHMVVHVTIAKVEVVEVAPAAAADATTAAEPELSQTKGKKDEEGKPLPKPAAAAPAAEKGAKEPAKKEGGK